ncbi:MAG: hypothetical protein PWQ20_509 [Thermotogaceae bacterium]|jgi:hypothetical protein|nr:hypothetical protein [Thermotogaceae bacterium]MDN5337439.1 hypothetical protein [Thermotogaceae bacterium]
MRPVDIQISLIRGPEAVQLLSQSYEAMSATQQTNAHEFILRTRQETEQVNSKDNVSEASMKNSTEKEGRTFQMVARKKRKDDKNDISKDEYRGKFIDVRL